MAISLGLIALDRAADYEPDEGLIWVYTGGPDGARILLSTIAGSMITVAGVVFSVTILTLSFASSQFGPRLLRNFMRDQGNQIVLGTFLATFIYSILVLRTVRGGADDFVPYISVTFAIVLALASLGVLIYFIHHVSASIQADNIIAAVGRDLREAIDRLFPAGLGYGSPGPESGKEQDLPESFEQEAQPIAAEASGYLQAVDNDGLIVLATERDLLLRLERRPGDFVGQEAVLASVWPAGRIDEEVVHGIRQAFILGTRRTPVQDVEFAIDQLVEIAVRALSPGVNDPFTAMTCVDHLGAALTRMVERPIPSACRYDEGGKLRVIADVSTFAGIVDAAFNQIRQYARCSASVTIRLLETIAEVATHASTNAQREVVLRHASMIASGSRKGLAEERDVADVQERYQAVLKALEKR
ncbi:MAG: DUF2254 domain-containing protein [Dehalococcoidia bacterium]